MISLFSKGTMMRPDQGYVEAMDLEEDSRVRDEGKITVKFTTQLPEEFRVVATPFEVSTSFARLGELFDRVVSFARSICVFEKVMKKPILLPRES